MSSSSPLQSGQNIMDKMCGDRLTCWRAPWVFWLPTDHCPWPLGSEWCHSGGRSGKEKHQNGVRFLLMRVTPTIVDVLVSHSGIKAAFIDLPDDAHQSPVRGFRVAKWPDVEGSQQQRVRKLQQDQRETQNTRYTHPESEKPEFRISLSFDGSVFLLQNRDRIGNLCISRNPKILFQP